MKSLSELQKMALYRSDLILEAANFERLSLENQKRQLLGMIERIHKQQTDVNLHVNKTLVAKFFLLLWVYDDSIYQEVSKQESLMMQMIIAHERITDA